MQNYKGTDVTTPCFNYDAVVAAKLSIFNTTEFASPLLFCHSLPFTVQIPIVNSMGPGCDSVKPCWAISQFSGAMEPEGPALTELVTNPLTGGTQIVGSKSAARAVYAFERYKTAAEDAYPVPVGTPIILLRVTQPQGGPAGYVRMSSTTVESGFPDFHVAEVVSKLDAIASKVMWGVIGRGKQTPAANTAAGTTTRCMLMYADRNFSAALPMLQMFSWGNALYFSRGDVSVDASGAHTALHGVNTARFPAIASKKIVYAAQTMILRPNLLPEFDPAAPDTGAANIQWSLHALRMSELSASVYAAAHCSIICSSQAPRLSGGSICAQLNRLFPSLAAASGACGVEGGNTRLQKTLAMVSLGVGAVEFIVIIIVLGFFFFRQP